MSSIDRHPGGRWRARYRTSDGRQRSRVFARESEAKRFLVEVEHRMFTGGYVDPRAGRVTFRTYAEEWQAMRSCRPQSAALAAQQLRDHVYPVIGDRPLGAIRLSDVQALVHRLEQSLAPSTARVVLGRVAAVLRSAVGDQVIARSPCEGVKRPTTGARVDKVLSVEQVAALADAMPAHYRAAVITGATTGLRPGELFGLTVPAVDFLRRSLVVERQLVRPRGDKGGVELVESLKTERSRRKVPLGQVTVDALAAHLAEFDPHPDLGLVFTDAAGRPIREQTFGRAWHRARHAAGVPAWAKGPHALRHHFASLLIARGSSPTVVQRRLGHASPMITMGVYGHLWPDDEENTRAAVDAEWLTLGSGVTDVSRAR